jgi:hypothetical protein
MRVSSLSNDRIIELVSKHFVPVWISRDRYQLDEPTREERLLLGKIDLDRRQRKLESGAVCVYIARANGQVLATLPVQRAHKPELLAPFLEKIIKDGKLSSRKHKDVAASKAPPKAQPKPSTPGGRLFIVLSRFDTPGPNRGNSRDVVELTAEEWASFLPPAKAKVGKSWSIKDLVASKLLRDTYPPLPFWSSKQVKVSTAQIKATLVERNDKESRLRLEGKVELIYPVRGRADDGRVTAKVVGLATLGSKDTTLQTLLLTSDEGRYVWRWEGKPQVKAMSFAISLMGR